MSHRGFKQLSLRRRNKPLVLFMRGVLQMGVGNVSDNQRIVNPGQGLVGQAVAAREPVPAVVVSFPSLEDAFCREVDLPRDPPEAEETPTSR